MAISEIDSDPRFLRQRPSSALGCFGWTLILAGCLLLTFGHLWSTLWDWMLLLLGLYFLYSGTKYCEHQQYFPGIMLIVVAGALVTRKLGWLHFPDWQFWSMLFLGLGLGFVSLWVTHSAGRWSLLPGGIFLIAAGMGFGCRSFWWYQRLLRSLCDLWPSVLIAIGALLLFKYWLRRRIF